MQRLILFARPPPAVVVDRTFYEVESVWSSIGSRLEDRLRLFFELDHD
jgi:hypothetical protein